MKKCKYELSEAILGFINFERGHYGKPSLQLDDNLRTQAQNRANEVTRANKYELKNHELVYKKSFYNYPIETSGDEATSWWRQQPNLHAVMVNQNQTKLGVGCAYGYTADKSAILNVVVKFQ